VSKEYWRVRFFTDCDDPRPVVYPPSGPYWISGQGDDYTILIAWLPKKSDLKKFWPEARVDEWYGKGPIEFTDRFPRPEYWKENDEALI
jgi:hypothetical protein